MMTRIDKWLANFESNQEMAYSLIRVFLGMALAVRGWVFFYNPEIFSELATEDKFHIWYSTVVIGHLLGGLMLAFGYFVRIGALIQIPIMIGAVFVAGESNGFILGGQSLELALLVLFLLAVYALFGPGKLTVGEFFNRKSEIIT